MLISIIVPAFNEERLLAQTLQHITQATSAFARSGWESELIVCDNNSTDRTAELARASGAQVVFEPYNQIARARNRGAAAAKGDWLLFVDADSKPSLELFTAVAEQIQKGGCIAGGSTIRMDEDSLLAGSVVSLWNTLSRCFHLLAGSFIFCEATIFRELGGFSLELFAGEELELTQRLKTMAGAKGKEIVILHRHPLLTSARKMHLYTLGEHFRFLVKAALRSGTVLRNREACTTWYDGRR